MTTTPTPEALPPEQAPPALDAAGGPAASVPPTSWLAAQHWCERLWHRL